MPALTISLFKRQTYDRLRLSRRTTGNHFSAFHNHWIDRVLAMLFKGLVVSSTRSATLPGSIKPTSLERSARAAFSPDTWDGESPAATSNSNS
ncbi:hypothetical protein ACVWZ4_007365 [Bradyrhizobium sp. USDA 4472]